jgi:hypothetical protein
VSDGAPEEPPVGTSLKLNAKFIANGEFLRPLATGLNPGSTEHFNRGVQEDHRNKLWTNEFSKVEKFYPSKIASGSFGSEVRERRSSWVEVIYSKCSIPRIWSEPQTLGSLQRRPQLPWHWSYNILANESLRILEAQEQVGLLH